MVRIPTKFTTRDLALFPDDEKHYEVIDGELSVTKSPHWNHEKAGGRLYATLDNWTFTESGFGEAVPSAGLVFDDENSVETDGAWIADPERLDAIIDQAGHLTEAPDLVIESLSPGSKNERRDRQLKLRLYSVRGVKEYWLVDWQTQRLEVYRRQEAKLQLVETLFSGDVLRSHLLPGFEVEISRVFAKGKQRPPS
jgi:Uma2 family endonuclease